MKFKIKTTESIYGEEEKKEYEGLGFKFEESHHFKNRPYYKIGDDIELEMPGLPDLMRFAEEWGGLILWRDGKDWVIEIYDGYRE